MKHILNIVDTDEYRITLEIHPCDKYLDKHCVIVETLVFDSYNNKWLEPRQTKLFLTKAELAETGNWISHISNVVYKQRHQLD